MFGACFGHFQYAVQRPRTTKFHSNDTNPSTSIFQDGGRDIAILLPAGQNLPACQISVTFLYPWLRYDYFRFSRLRHDRHIILHLSTNFRPNRTIHDIVVTSYPFSIAILLPVLFFCDFAHLGRLKSARRPNFGQDISIHS